jgi:hypothetical protein
MSCQKPDNDECVVRPFSLVRFRHRDVGERNEASIGFRAFKFRVAKFATLLAFAFVCCGAEMSRAQVSDAEKESYADALAYCRGDVSRPMALRNDKRVLCLDGQVSDLNEFLPAASLAQGGLFVVRSRGGNIINTIGLADLLLAREATIIVNDYCLGICANYLFIASVKTFVPENALVAWINHATGPNNCLGFVEGRRRDIPRLQEKPCDLLSVDSRTRELIRLKDKFYKGRTLNFVEPPESVTVRRDLKRRFDATGKYPDDVYWTWNPRNYAGAIRTKVIYEAYSESQDDVNAIVARLGLKLSVIYDP